MASCIPLPMNPLVSKILAILLMVTTAGCKKQETKVSEAEKSYYSQLIQATYRHSISTQSRVQALQWVHQGRAPESILQSATGDNLKSHLEASAQRIRSIPKQGKEISMETLGLAEEVAARRSLQSLRMNEVSKPDAAAEFVRWLIDAASLDTTQGTEQQRDELRMRMMFARIGNFAAQSARSELLMEENQRSVQQLEADILAQLELHRTRIGGKRAVQLGAIADHAALVIQEQEGRAAETGKLLTLDLVEKTLIGSSSANWRNFEAGEIKYFKIVSQSVAGHCILTEAELEVVSKTGNTKRTLTVRMAHELFLDGSIRLLAIQ